MDAWWTRKTDPVDQKPRLRAVAYFQRQFPALKRKAKADTDRQDAAWLKSLFWDFRDIGGATSAEGIDRGFLEVGRYIARRTRVGACLQSAGDRRQARRIL